MWNILIFGLQDPFQDNPTNPGGKLVFNLGNISEDIIKDGRKLYENGLPQDGNIELLPETHMTVLGSSRQLISLLIYAFRYQWVKRRSKSRCGI